MGAPDSKTTDINRAVARIQPPFAFYRMVAETTRSKSPMSINAEQVEQGAENPSQDNLEAAGTDDGNENGQATESGEAGQSETETPAVKKWANMFESPEALEGAYLALLPEFTRARQELANRQQSGTQAQPEAHTPAKEPSMLDIFRENYPDDPNVQLLAKTVDDLREQVKTVATDTGQTYAQQAVGFLQDVIAQNPDIFTNPVVCGQFISDVSDRMPEYVNVVQHLDKGGVIDSATAKKLMAKVNNSLSVFGKTVKAQQQTAKSTATAQAKATAIPPRTPAAKPSAPAVDNRPYSERLAAAKAMKFELPPI
jgi:hypothetical protein